MKKPTSVLLAVILLGIHTVCPNKKISFKSHSGSTENFSIALNENLFDMEFSNFGMAPQREVKNAQLDSVIYVSDGVAIMVTSEYCTRVDRATDKPVSDLRLWKAGRDSVFDHPLFSRNHSLDSIKKILRNQYHFNNPAEKVVFVGYDNKKMKYKTKGKKSSVVPVSSGWDSNNQSPFGPQLVLMIAAITISSLLIAGGAWLWFQRKAKGTTAA